MMHRRWLFLIVLGTALACGSSETRGPDGPDDEAGSPDGNASDGGRLVDASDGG